MSDKLLTAADMPFLRATRALAPFLSDLPPEPDPAPARCPGCGIPTVPDHEELTEGARLCGPCYLAFSEEDRHP